MKYTSDVHRTFRVSLCLAAAQRGWPENWGRYDVSIWIHPINGGENVCKIAETIACQLSIADLLLQVQLE